MKTIYQLSICEVKMLLLSGCIRKHSKVLSLFCCDNRWKSSHFFKLEARACLSRFSALKTEGILVPRGRAPFGQHQESQPLAKSNTGSPEFTDFPSLCACSESSLTNLIGSGLNLLCLQSGSKTECRWTRPEVAILGADEKERGLWGENRRVKQVGGGQGGTWIDFLTRKTGDLLRRNKKKYLAKNILHLRSSLSQVLRHDSTDETTGNAPHGS